MALGLFFGGFSLIGAQCRILGVDHMVEASGEHWDLVSSGDISAFDRVCGLIGGCPWIDEPADKYWEYQKHWFRALSGQWYVGWEGWVLVATCGIYSGCPNPINVTAPRG
jgi:hypothetical protein